VHFYACFIFPSGEQSKRHLLTNANLQYSSNAPKTRL